MEVKRYVASFNIQLHSVFYLSCLCQLNYIHTKYLVSKNRRVLQEAVGVWGGVVRYTWKSNKLFNKIAVSYRYLSCLC